MRSRYVHGLALAAVALLSGLAIFVAACDGSSVTMALGQDTATTAAAGAGAEAAETTTAASSVGESGAIFLDGLVDYPMTLTLLDMDYMYWVADTVDNPELGPIEYEGVLLVDIFDYVGVQTDATTVVITGSDGSKVEVPLDEIPGDEAMIAVGDGGTMNAVLPGLGSEAWVKDVVAMHFM